MHARRWLLATAAALAIIGVTAGAVAAGRGGHLRIETGWYQDHEVTFLQPSLFSSKPNGGVLACYGLGPDLTGIHRPAAPLYVIFDDTAVQDHCDGDPTMLRHEPVLSVAPGDPGYTAAWRLVLIVEATPGSIDLGAHPFTDVAQVQAALKAGTLIDVTQVLAPGAPVEMIAPVIGGSHPR